MKNLVRDDVEDAMQRAREIREQNKQSAYVSIICKDVTTEQLYHAVSPLVDSQKDLSTVIVQGTTYIKAFENGDF
jgi:hypothetical protein